MDGLMLDSEPIYKASWQDSCRDLGFELDDHSYETFIGRPPSDCEPELQEHFGPQFPLVRFQARWPQLWREIAERDGIPLKPGFEDLYALLNKRGLPIAVATSSDADYTRFTLEAAGLANHFRVIVTRDQVENGKPAPDLYREAARRLGQDAAGCLALEDSDAGVLSAAAAGMRAIQVPDLKQPSVEARRVAWRVLPSLHDVRELIMAEAE